MNRQLRRGNPQQAVEQALSVAAGHVAAGRYRAAIKELGKHAAAGRHPAGQNILGNAHLRAGDPEAALAAFDAAITLAPQFPEAHCNRGVALQELGRLDEALAALERAAALRTAYPLAHYNRGNVLKAMGRFDVAAAAYEQATRLEPRFAEAHLNRGVALLGLGRGEAALRAFDLALRLRPNWSEAALGRATALERLHRPAAALEAIDNVLKSDPDNAEALTVRGHALAALGRRDEAGDAYGKALAGLADTAEGLVSRATVLARLDRFDEALTAADAALGQGAGGAAHFARAVALRGLCRLEEQLAALDAAASAGQSGGALPHARAVSLAELGRLDEAGAAFEQAVAAEPGDPRIRFDHAHLLLHRGDYARGLEEHERRLNLPGFAYGDRAVPRWQGEAIAGKRLLVHAEQGLGDAIQMLRYLPRLKDAGASLTLAVPPPLRRLAALNVPDVEVLDGNPAPDAFDWQVSLMSLPYVYATRLDSIPADVPYLVADPERVVDWQERIGSEGFKVGICWSGNPAYRADRYHSIPLAAFAPLAAIPAIRLISLQAVHGLDQLDAPPDGMTVETLGPEIADNPDGLYEIAAAMESLDLVLCADTAVAHLAGALGRPAWVAIRFQPEWRWPEGRAESPWYPTLWLFRQPAIGDWDSVIADIARYLDKHLGGAG